MICSLSHPGCKEPITPTIQAMPERQASPIMRIRSAGVFVRRIFATASSTASILLPWLRRSGMTVIIPAHAGGVHAPVLKRRR